jgi:hypothetical protein
MGDEADRLIEQQIEREASIGDDFEDPSDWHAFVPADQWRPRKGPPIRICKMNDRHLFHALRFSTRPQHCSRRPVLLEEWERRGRTVPRGYDESDVLTTLKLDDN